MLYGNNAGPWRRLPAIRLLDGLRHQACSTSAGNHTQFSLPQDITYRGYQGLLVGLALLLPLLLQAASPRPTTAMAATLLTSAGYLRDIRTS